MHLEELNSLIQFFFITKTLTKAQMVYKHQYVYDRVTLHKGDMSKRQKKKALVVEGEPEVEIITKVEYIYEYTKATTGVETDYKWGEIYMIIVNQNVPDAGFEELTIYANIEKPSLMKVATRPELFL